MADLTQRLRQARERAGYRTATEAAIAFGWPPSTYLGHENGSRGLTKDAANRYAKAFGISWTWLLGDDKPFADVAALLTAIPVNGVIDPGAYRAPDFRVLGMPDELHVEIFGYAPEELTAFQLYGSEDDHFIIVAHRGTSNLIYGDELVVRRRAALDDKVETACWRLVKGVRGSSELELAYARHVQMGREPLNMLDEGVEIMGIVIGELRIKRRPEAAPDPFAS